jgi:hypothetical protein
MSEKHCFLVRCARRVDYRWAPLPDEMILGIGVQGDTPQSLLQTKILDDYWQHAWIGDVPNLGVAMEGGSYCPAGPASLEDHHG